MRKGFHLWAAGAVMAGVGLGATAAAAAPWTPPRALCDPCGIINPPAEIAVSANGAAVVAWMTDDRRAVASRAPNGTLSPLTLSSGGRPDRSQPTTVAIGDDGLAVAAWSDGASVRAVVREPGGQWGAPEVIGSGGQPDAAVAAGGTIYVAIAAAASGEGIRVARRPPGAAWALEQVASGAIGHVPQIAAAGSMVMVAWRDGVAENLRILSSIRRDGAWQAADDLPVPAGTLTVPAIAVDDQGNALALWRQLASGGALVQASHRPPAGPWGAAQQLGTGPTAEPPEVAFSGVGDALAVWRGTNAAGGPPAVRVARFDSSSASWAAAVDVAQARLRGGPALGVGEAGKALVGWIGAGPRAAEGSSITGRFDAPEQIRAGAGNPSPFGLIDVGVDRQGRAVAVWQERLAPNSDSLYLAARSVGGGGGQVRLTAAQLRINQRISQAAVRRINALTATVNGEPPPSQAPAGTPGRVTLSAKQLLINQRISQAAVRRANALAGRLEGRFPTAEPPARDGDVVALSARQLLIGQRIAQAAVRRANALAERIPDIPFPPPGPLEFNLLDRLLGEIPEAERGVMRVDAIQGRGSLGDDTPLAVGDTIPVVFPSSVPMPGRGYSDGSRIGAVGIVSDGVMYGIYVSIADPSELGD